MKTYRIEISGDGEKWHTLKNYRGMKKGEAKGVMRGADDFYTGQNFIRMVSEQGEGVLSLREGRVIEGVTGFNFDPLFDQEDYFEILDRSPIEPHCRQALKAIYEMNQRLVAVESRIDELEQMPPWDEG